MAMVAPRARVRMHERVLTAADLAGLPSELSSGPALYELDNGRLVIMTPPGDEHGAIELNIGTALKTQGEWRGFGKARSGEVGIVLWKDPDRVVGADAVFISNASLPIRRSPEGYLGTIPDLVVEVASRNDTRAYLRRKVRDYLAAGVRLVWLVEPGRRTVTVHRPDPEPQVRREDDTLTLDELIPAFALPVRDALQE